LVINCFLVADCQNKVYINQSNALLKPDSMSRIYGAEIQIKEANDLLATFNDVKKSVSIDNFTPKAGHTYEIRVSHPGKQTAIATTSIPYNVNIKITEPIEDIDWVQGQDYEDHFAMLKIQIDDTASTKDYYLVQVTGRFISTEPESFTKEQIDTIRMPINMLLNHAAVDAYMNDEGNYNPPMRENMGSFIQGGYGSKMILSDALFNGKSQIFELQINTTWLHKNFPNFKVKVSFQAQVYRINEAYYKYLTSYARHQYTKEDPFAEKVPVYNNIENGFGIFASASLSTAEAVYSKQPKP
jgi:hypothetical protein